ncbi:MAG: hypothetical protein ABIQ02_16735 [Saprospiraceae bacterium]
MKKYLLSALLSCTFIVFTTTYIMAQDNKTVKPEAITNFSKFVGNWNADANLTMDGKTYNLNYLVNGKLTADGNGLYVDESFSNPDLGTMIGENLVGYNPNDKKVHWFSVDNMGTAHEHIGDWINPNLFLMEHSEMQNGKKYIEKISMEFKNANTLEFNLVATLDGKEVQKGTGTFKK